VVESLHAPAWATAETTRWLIHYEGSCTSRICRLTETTLLRFLIRRLLLTIPVVLGVATLVFSLIHLVPGDPAQAMLGESASPADMTELRVRLGLDRPLIVQYGGFLKGLVSNGVSGEMLPIVDPEPAKAALAVKYQERLVHHQIMGHQTRRTID